MQATTASTTDADHTDDDATTAGLLGDNQKRIDADTWRLAWRISDRLADPNTPAATVNDLRRRLAALMEAFPHLD